MEEITITKEQIQLAQDYLEQLKELGIEKDKLWAELYKDISNN